MLTTVADVRERLKLSQLSDEEIAVHLKRAQRDFANVSFDDADDRFDEREAVACKAIYYLAPLLWQRIQQRANEYDETLQTFGDVEVFRDYWLQRAETVPFRTDEGTVTTGGMKWAVV